MAMEDRDSLATVECLRNGKMLPGCLGPRVRKCPKYCQGAKESHRTKRDTDPDHDIKRIAEKRALPSLRRLSASANGIRVTVIK